MKNILFISLAILFLYPGIQRCLPKGNNKTIAKNKSVTFKDKKSRELTKLDSLEQENNEEIKAAGKNLNKFDVNLSDSSMFLVSNIRKNHRIFGYEKPDIKSKRLILFSVFTIDVENNPFNCELGAFYETQADYELYYLAKIGHFIKVAVIDRKNKSTIIYIERKWVVFDKD